MKKANLVLGLIFFLSLNAIQAQEEKKANFNFIMYGGIGHGIVENKNEVNYSMNNNCGELLLSYNFKSGFGFATGFGYAELTGNAFNSIGHFYEERTIIRIPILATIKYELTQKTMLLIDFGVYGQNIIKDQFSYNVDKVQKDVYGGWNYGFQIGTGFVFEFFEGLSFGLSFKSQADFNSIKTNQTAMIKDEQKFETLSSVGILMIREF